MLIRFAGHPSSKKTQASRKLKETTTEIALGELPFRKDSRLKSGAADEYYPSYSPPLQKDPFPKLPFMKPLYTKWTNIQSLKQTMDATLKATHRVEDTELEQLISKMETLKKSFQELRDEATEVSDKQNWNKHLKDLDADLAHYPKIRDRISDAETAKKERDQAYTMRSQALDNFEAMQNQNQAAMEACNEARKQKNDATTAYEKHRRSAGKESFRATCNDARVNYRKAEDTYKNAEVSLKEATKQFDDAVEKYKAASTKDTQAKYLLSQLILAH
jgi:hypothetical protein